MTGTEHEGSGGKAGNGTGAPKNGAEDDKIVFFIDKTRFVVSVTSLTARELLRDYAEENPDETSLLLKHAGEQRKYTADDIVDLKNGMHFSVLHNGPTTVS
ncbi:MAG: hypothetical protein V4813_13010 [Gemmatimonadota bacterium]